MSKVEYFTNDSGRWFYRVKSGNGRVVSSSSESDGYKSRSAAIKGFRSAQSAFAAVQSSREW